MSYTEKQFKSLPKWAQDEITRLTMDAEYQRQRERKAFLGETDVFMDDHIIRGYIGLPPHSRITFGPKVTDEHGDRILPGVVVQSVEQECSADRTTIGVRSVRDNIEVRPRASDSVWITVRK